MSAAAAMTTASSTASRGPTVPTGITVVRRGLRSTNLERDVHADHLLPPLYIGARIQDALGRLAGALEDPDRPRAWSLTGPYGSGKSTLALLITALLGAASPRRRHADNIVAEYNPDLAARLQAGRRAAATRRTRQATTHEPGRDQDAPEGFLIAVATARRQALTATLRQAFRQAADARWPDSTAPQDVTVPLDALNSASSGPAELLATAAALCNHSPVLLIIDEFGKTLEHLAADSGQDADDLFLLQELAEKGAGRKGLPLYIITLQHMSFLDYASRSATLQTREWAKVQGRFEDINFAPHVGDGLALLRRSLDHRGVTAAARTLLATHHTASAQAWSEHGLDAIIAPDDTLFADLYPLHPLTAVATPLLAAQIGQHDRSITGFLCADEPNSVARFLAANAQSTDAHASTIQLPQLYDYFLSCGRTTILVSANARRWIEIDSRISEAHGLSDTELRILKTVGLLNLVDASGALRASAHMVLFALTDPAGSDGQHSPEALHATLRTLQERGFLVYREFADEYRVWQGTDVDLQARVDELWGRCDDHAVAAVLKRHLPDAVVAGRHSQRTGMLRHFVTTVSGHTTGDVDDTEDGTDGLMLFHLGGEDNLPTVRTSLPVVAGVTTQAAAVLDAGRQLLCLETLRDDDTLDAVARREVAERTSQAAAALATVLAEAFSPTHARWLLIQVDGHTSADDDSVLQARSLSGIVSAACEIAYPLTPHVRNEMLGRHRLTTQAAKARGCLLTAMIESPQAQRLGIDGFGPQRAMYDGVVQHMGLHAIADDRPGPHDSGLVAFGYVQPDEHNHAYPAWQALTDALSNASRQTPLDEIFQLLMAPPYGVKAGVLPVLVVAALLRRSDDVALFEDGNYQPLLTAQATERMVKAPGRFTVKAAPTSSGHRRLVLDLLSGALGTEHARPGRMVRNPTILAITRALLDNVRTLSSYARRTRRVSAEAQAVRTVLTTSGDPVDMLFSALPQALGLPQVTATDQDHEGQAQAYVSKLTAALDELSSATAVLRNSAVTAIAEAFRLPAELTSLRHGLRGRVRGLATATLEPQLRGLVDIALNEVLTDDDWIDPLVVRLVGVPLNDWTDANAELLGRHATQLALALDRIGHLYDDRGDQDSGADGHQAQLVTVTTPDGAEVRTLVRTSPRARADAARLTRDILARARDELGPDGGRLLLATLAEQLLAVDDDPTASLS